MDRYEMFLAVNPVFATAKGCLGLLKETGIKEAVQLAQEIDTTVSGASNTPPDVGRAYMVSNEARYHIGNILAEESGCDVIVDLPCGYVPRGLVIADMKKTFYGFDLPAVIEEVEPVIRKIASKEQKEYLNFRAVDATNYDSMKSALSDVKGNICILTDGLLGYFNEPELDSVCKNINRLLAEYGGCWITADKFSREVGAVTFSVLTDSDGTAIKEMMSKGGAKVADIAVNHTVIQDGTPEEGKKFFSDYGFEIRELSYADKMPDLLCLKDSPEDMAKLREAYKSIRIWIMTVKKSSASDNKKGKAFKAEFSVDGSRLFCEVSGRLDTITAADLLTGFRENRTDDITEITVDMTETEYISSAGLRVLLSMCKTLPNMADFHIINYSDSIKDILKVTGFDQLFGMAD
ncbi:MAG: STAS domain-containing protein [Lachnospiraceae bacterium]|nr:STAS domain-containing protein [Lachnospiraceae bacterium]